jgi:colanic acid/amylovoran biosynthesis glycosyltransferase
MHNVPSDSGFLAAKFVGLLSEFDIHLLIWDTTANIDEFVKRWNIGQYRDRIVSGVYKPGNVVRIANAICRVAGKKAVRNYLLFGSGTIVDRIKLVLFYYPIFIVAPDIVHFEFGTLAKDIAILKQLTTAKMSVSFRGYDLNYVGLLDSRYYLDVWTNIDAVHFLGEDLKRRAVQRGYQLAKVEALIPPAVDTKLFHPGEPAGRIAGQLRVVSVGRLTWKKGFEYAIQALYLLKNKGIAVDYTIVGEGEHRQAIQYTIHELGMQEQIKLVGRLPATLVKESLSRADVFLHPALSEGFCNSVLEAQAMGLPVICTDADGLGENIVDGETGLLVPKWDVQQLASKLEWCHENREDARKMGERGIARVQKHFKIEDQIKAFVQFYNRVHETT